MDSTANIAGHKVCPRCDEIQTGCCDLATELGEALSGLMRHITDRRIPDYILAESALRQVDGESQDRYAITVTGDGGRSWVVAENQLHQALHDAYCTCAWYWPKCTTEGVLASVETLDDDNNWTHEYPDRKRHVWADRGEDYSITIARLAGR